MARSRNIKPAFFKNEELADIDPIGRLLFIGLWTLSDRNGLVENRPKRIRAEIFPYEHDVDINRYITVLEQLGFIQLLTDGESDYLYIVNFSKHQNPHHTEKTPLPDPKGLNVKGFDGLTVKEPLLNGENPADSLTLIPDPLNIDSRKNNTSKYFDDWWSVYPKKVEKKKALEIWKRRKLDSISQVLVNDVAMRMVNDRQWKQGYIPNPTTYLNGDRWEDEIKQESQKAVNNEDFDRKQYTGTATEDIEW